jgi:hypothetical protein
LLKLPSHHWQCVLIIVLQLSLFITCIGAFPYMFGKLRGTEK